MSGLRLYNVRQHGVQGVLSSNLVVPTNFFKHLPSRS